MNDKTFLRVLFALLGVCVALTLAHLIWAIYAYEHCSIIYFVGKELW